METIAIPGTDLQPTRIGLGTWAIGGWLWGGTSEADSIRTIEAAVEHGITLIDTAPIYGFGHAEEIIGKALRKSDLRAKVVLATKCGLAWFEGGQRPHRNASRARILSEVEDSLQRLKTDVIDIYQVHWPDYETPIEETAQTLKELLEQGKIRAIGVSNFAPTQMEKRNKEWGPAAFQEKLGATWRHFASFSDGWLRVVRGAGRDALERAYREVLEGRARPEEGHVLSLRQPESQA